MNLDGLEPQARVLDIADLTLGDEVVLTWTVQEREIDLFADLSSDRNPLHMDADFARSKGFSDRVAHGFLLGSKVSALVGMMLPGRDCLILEQTLAYPKPIYPGDVVALTGKVDELSLEQRIVKVGIRAYRTEGDKRVLLARGHVLCRNQ